MSKTITIHDSHDWNERLTACGRKWSALPAEAQEGQTTCKACIRNMRALWGNRA